MFLAPVKIPAADKLRVLQGLDQFRRWETLDDERQCIQCGQLISGWEIEVVGGTRGLGPLRLQCPTENCRAIPMDWIIPTGQAKVTQTKNGCDDDGLSESRPRAGLFRGWFRSAR